MPGMAPSMHQSAREKLSSKAPNVFADKHELHKRTCPPAPTPSKKCVGNAQKIATSMRSGKEQVLRFEDNGNGIDIGETKTSTS